MERAKVNAKIKDKSKCIYAKIKRQRVIQKPIANTNDRRKGETKGICQDHVQRTREKANARHKGKAKGKCQDKEPRPKTNAKVIKSIGKC